MKKFIIQGIVLLVVLFGALMIGFGKAELPFLPQPAKLSTLIIGDTKVNIELADNQTKRALGLGGRESLASSSGMLFTFDSPKRYQFWMKGMKFPLDFIWLRNKKIVDILKNIPPPEPGQKDETLPIYAPITEVDSILEVNAGFVDAHGIKVGDSVQMNK